MSPLDAPPPTLRGYLASLDQNLADVANNLWRISKTIHNCQNSKDSKDSNENGVAHVTAVEHNIYRLLQTTTRLNQANNFDLFTPFEIFLLSCAACCHDFDQALSAPPPGYTHGKGSGDFVAGNADRLGLSRAMARAVQKIVACYAVHDSEFQDQLHILNKNAVCSHFPYNQQRVALLLKAGDILHCDNSRIPAIRINPDGLTGSDRENYLFRYCTDGWSVNGDRIIIHAEPINDEERVAISKRFTFMQNTRWPCVADGLERYDFPCRLDIHPPLAPVDVAGNTKPEPRVAVAGSKPVTPARPTAGGGGEEAPATARPGKTITILHLSDLHFGMETSDKISNTQLARRKNTLTSMERKFDSFDPEWQPSIVVISGDIGWQGRSEDYDLAAAWLRDNVLQRWGLTADDLVMCPGNHDLDRKKTIGLLYPPSEREADEWLAVEHLDNFQRLFIEYQRFYKEKLKVSPMMADAGSSCLMGCRRVNGLRFVALNSAWFCRGDEDRGKLWLGRPQLEVMNSAGQLVDPDTYDSDPITIAVMHHPPEWLHDAEVNAWGERFATHDYLAERCHVILCGHVHGSLSRPNRINNRAYLFKGGAAYSGADYRNNFSLLRVDPANRTVERRGFEFDPRKGRWNGEGFGPYFLGKENSGSM